MFTLSTRGSERSQLIGPLQPGFAMLPRKFTFKIVAATGKYLGDVAKGTATLDEVEADATAKSSATASSVIVGPIFGLTFRPALPTS